MSRWLQSGLRRDLCVAIYALEDPTGQTVKTALEDHYDDRLPPRSVHGALDELERSGYVTRSTDGLHDRYALTQAGEAALLDHFEWLETSIAAGRGEVARRDCASDETRRDDAGGGTLRDDADDAGDPVGEHEPEE